MLNDLLIFAKIREGDIKTFEQTFRLYYAPLCMFSTCIVGRSDDAEEIVQELFYVLWRDHEKLQLQYSLKSYLYGAVRKQSLQYLEHEAVKRRYAETITNKDSDYMDADADSKIEYDELKQLIGDTLKTLPARRAQIFKLHRQKGMKYEEIASALQISVKTVETEITKALKVLRHKIELYFNMTYR